MGVSEDASSQNEDVCAQLILTQSGDDSDCMDAEIARAIILYCFSPKNVGFVEMPGLKLCVMPLHHSRVPEGCCDCCLHTWPQFYF
jgi:hypothetical protein